ncbi:type II toxin-antitoxin system VapC family toxin [Rhodopila sp.]|uniref:type II toxin-antitoxin system VapC family toxin n=1 Tax=Rhodopila sp. TaxID=2480087 RepID=UPI003D11AA70
MAAAAAACRKHLAELVYLLDTNVISELRKRRPHPAVVDWLRGVPADTLYLSAMTLGELQAGVEATRAQDHEKAAEIESWIDQVAGIWNVLSLDARVMRAWARLMVGKSDYLLEDGMVAAVAVVHRLIVVTRNVKDFKPFQVEILNPFLSR